jgi:4-carboxymuconolactone decarboxylase
MTNGTFADDIFDDSGCRLPLVDRDGLEGARAEIYDAHVTPGGSSVAGLWGPGGVKLHSPRVSELTQALTRYLRYEAGYSGIVREVAILVTARECESQFEWTAHEPLALKEGVSQEVIDAIKYRKDITVLPETEATIIQMGREMFADHRVTPETFARALKIFDRGQLVDLVSLMANYAGTAAFLATFDMQLPPGKDPLLPQD